MTLLSFTRSLFPGICLVVLFLAICAPGGSAITLTPGNSTTAVIAQGDPIYIQGIATGQPQVGLQIWFIGPNFVKVTTVPVNNDGTYQYILQPADTANLAPGAYFVVVQHPMMNGRFDIIYDTGTGNVINLQSGQTIFQITGSGSLQSPSSATALIHAISSQNVDDTFTTVSFYVSNPSVMINPIGTVQVGDTFTINGSTNLAVGNDLLVEISSSSFQPTSKMQPAGFSGMNGMVKVMPGTGTTNSWSYPVDTSEFTPDQYTVTVSGVLQTVTATGTFTVVPAGSLTATTSAAPVTPTTSAPLAVTETIPPPVNFTPAVVTTTASISTATPASPALPVTTTYTPLPEALGITALGVAGVLRRRL
jgi:hypothetical protein